MPLQIGSLLAPADLSFDFRRGTITDVDGRAVGSLRWRRRPGAVLASDLGFRDAAGSLRWWLRPGGWFGGPSDLVVAPDGRSVGEIGPQVLMADGAAVGWIEQQRYPNYLPAWRIVGEQGLVAEIRRERRWVAGEVARRELWHVRVEPSVDADVRCLVASLPYRCWRRYDAG